MYSRWISLILMGGVLFAGVSSTPLPGHSHHRHRRQIPCDHPLRLVVPSLFSHCETMCTYSDWTAWNKTEQRIATLASECESKLYFIQQRTRAILSVIGNRSDCNEVTQTEPVCYPTKVEWIINRFHVAGTGQKLDQPRTSKFRPLVGPPGSPSLPLVPSGPLDPSGPLVPPEHPVPCESSGPFGHCEPSGLPGDPALRGRREVSDKHCPPHTGSSGEVCKNLTASRICKRSAGNYDDSHNKRHVHVERPIINENILSVNDGSAPIPFDWDIHGSHFRQRRETRCGNDDVQHILFVLDSSGSVSPQNYTKMKEAIAKLVPLFCKQIQTALISFSSDIKLEYCFNCFENTFDGRAQAQAAIEGAEYLGDCTNTGATAKCICDTVLSSSCGISTTECLDVIFITDGKSNDPNLKVCNEIKCLHNQVGISTSAIGIGGYDRSELECIAHNTDDFGMFEFETFQEFKESIDEVIELVTNATIDGNWHSCSTRDRSYSPTGSPYI